jgi:hypothetical protein
MPVLKVFCKYNSVITRINDAVYRMQRHWKAKMVENQDRLAPYLATTRDEEPTGWSSVEVL